MLCLLVCLQSERETAEARFTKLKLQAKAKMATLNKQIADLKAQEGATVSPLAELKITPRSISMVPMCILAVMYSVKML